MIFSLNNFQSTIFRLRYLLGSSFIFAVIIGIGYSSYQPTSPIHINEVRYETGSVDLSFSPTTLELDPNTTQDLTLTINANNSLVNAVVVELEYDPATLTVNSITQGDFLSNTLSSGTIADGKLRFTYAAPPDSGGIDGFGTLAIISITSSNVDSILSFNTQTQAVVAESNSNALHTATDSFITITSVNDSINDYPTTSLTLAANPTCTNISLSWDPIKNAPGYYLDLSTTDNFTNFNSSNRLSGSTIRHTFTNLSDNTHYYARITLASIPNFPQFSSIFQVNTKDCSIADNNNQNNTPTPIPTSTPIITPTPSSTPLPTQTSLIDTTPQSNQPNFTGTLNDIFDSKSQDQDVPPTNNPGFFQRIFLGWRAIFNRLSSIFQ